jgi:hypothetical protein
VFAYNNGWKYGSEIRIFNRAKGDGTFEPLRQVSIDGGNTWIDLNWQTRTRGEFRETLSLERKELMDSWQTNYKRIDLVKILDSNGNPNDILNQGNNTDQCIAQIEVWSRPN